MKKSENILFFIRFETKKYNFCKYLKGETMSKFLKLYEQKMKIYEQIGGLGTPAGATTQPTQPTQPQQTNNVQPIKPQKPMVTQSTNPNKAEEYFSYLSTDPNGIKELQKFAQGNSELFKQLLSKVG